MARGILFTLSAVLLAAIVAGAVETGPAKTAEDAAQLAASQAMTMPGDAPKHIRIRAAPAATASLQAVGAQDPKDRFWDCACTKDATKSPAGTSPWSCACALAQNTVPAAAAKPAQPAPKVDAKPAPAPLKAEQPKPATLAAPKVNAAPKQQQQPKAGAAPLPAAPTPQEAPTPKAEAPKTDAPQPKVVKAINVLAPKADAKKPEAPKTAPVEQQKPPVAEQPAKVAEPQPAAQQPAPVQTPSQQEPLAQPAQPAQPAEPLPAADPQPAQSEAEQPINRRRGRRSRRQAAAGGLTPEQNPGSMGGMGRMPSSRTSSSLGLPRGGGAGNLGMPGGLGGLGLPGGMGAFAGPRAAPQQPVAGPFMPRQMAGQVPGPVAGQSNMDLFHRQMGRGPAMPSEGPFEPRTLSSLLRPSGPHGQGARREELRREEAPEFDRDELREMTGVVREDREEPREMAGVVREDHEEPHEMAGEVPHEMMPRQHPLESEEPREMMPRERPEEPEWERLTPGPRETEEDFLHEGRMSPREETVPRQPLHEERRMSIREEPMPTPLEEPMPMPREEPQPMPRTEPVPIPAPEPAAEPAPSRAPAPAISAPTADSLIADDDSVTVVSELKMTAGFQGDCSAHAVDWVQERASRLMVADLDYQGIKSKVKSALWSCDQNSGRVVMKFVMQIEPVCDYRAYLRKFSCNAQRLVPVMAAALAKVRDTDMCAFKLGEPDRACKSMDTYTYTVTQPELPPVAALGSWAELSIAKNRDWTGGSYKPWYGDMLAYHPEDPYGIARSATKDANEILAEKPAEKRINKQEEKNEVAKPVEKPAAKDESKMVGEKPALVENKPTVAGKLVTSSMRRLMEALGF